MDDDLSVPVELPPPDITCSVVRCTRDRSRAIDVSPSTADRGIFHALQVCAEHDAAMQLEPWFAPGEGRAIYMGVDLAALGLHKLVNAIDTISDDRFSEVDDYHRTFRLEYETVGGDGTRHALDLLVTDDLRKIFRQLGGAPWLGRYGEQSE